jgi:hypothetical protein
MKLPRDMDSLCNKQFHSAETEAECRKQERQYGYRNDESASHGSRLGVKKMVAARSTADIRFIDVRTARLAAKSHLVKMPIPGDYF